MNCIGIPVCCAALILHLDFNSIQMRKDAVIGHLRTAAAAGYTAVLWEVEDKIRWETCPECVHPEAFSKREFRTILEEADRLGLEPIPLLQTFGHAEYILRREKYRAWRENPEIPTCYCVSKPEVRVFLKKFIAEYLELFGGRVREFHLGGDEARQFGTCPVCSKRNRFELYNEHLNEVADILRARGVRAAIWCDMMLTKTDRSQVNRFPKDLTAWYWDYYFGFEGGKNASLWAGKVNLLIEGGYPVVFAPASGSCGDSAFLPLYGRHLANVVASADFARRHRLRGLCMTSWSVHLYPKRLQYPLWELGAKRFLDPGETTDADVAAVLRRRLGPIGAETLCRLTQWDLRLQNFDCRFTDYAGKCAQPFPSGTALRKIALNESQYKDYRAPDADEILRLRSGIAAALKEVEAVGSPADDLRVFADGARLTVRHLSALAELRKTLKRPNGLPIEETLEFYLREQTPQSATNSMRLVWDPL